MKKLNARAMIAYGVMLALWGGAQAQEEVVETAEAPSIMVTATRTEQAVEDVNASVEVIDKAQIEAFSGRNVTEILQYAAGVDVAERGNETRLSVRGMNTNQTLILVDGMRRTDKASGSVLANIQVEDIERIEIVRGPMSALYGSDAMGGVINIITSKAQDGVGYGFDLTAGATEDGQRETGIIGAYVNVKTGPTGHRFSLEAKQRGEFKVDEDSEETDLREEERQNFSYRGSHALNDSDELSWSAEYAKQDDEGTALDSGGNPMDMIETEERHYLSLGYVGMFGGGIGEATLGRGVSDSTSEKGTGSADETTSTKNELQAQYTFWPGRAHTSNVGYGYLDEEFDSTITDGAEDRQVNSVFAQDQWRLAEAVEMTLGLRHDDYSDFGSATSPHLALAWRPGDWTLRTGYGEAFRAPSMMELYSNQVLLRKTVLGNPDLDPESSQSVEAAVARRFARGRVELVVYRTEVEDLIQRYDVIRTVNAMGRVVEWVQSYTNVAEAEINGVELTWNLRPSEAWNVDGSIEHLDAEDADSGEPLEHRAEWTAKLDNSLRVDKAVYRLRINHTQDYLSGSADLEPYYSDYTTVDVRLDYQLSRPHALFFGIDNILDDDIPDNMLASGVPSDPGARYFYAGYRGRF